MDEVMNIFDKKLNYH